MYLLTIPVILFQLAIYFSISAAGKAGTARLIAVTGIWTLFTLFGSIFTAGLLLLQLCTIMVAYGKGRKNAAMLRTKQDSPPADSIPSQQGNSTSKSEGIALLILGVVLFVGVWMLMSNSTSQSKHQTSVQRSATAEIPARATTAAMQAEPLVQAAPRGQQSKSLKNADARNCLSLGDAKAIAACAEKFR